MENQWVTRFTAEMMAEWWSECTKSGDNTSTLFIYQASVLPSDTHYANRGVKQLRRLTGWVSTSGDNIMDTDIMTHEQKCREISTEIWYSIKKLIEDMPEVFADIPPDFVFTAPAEDLIYFREKHKKREAQYQADLKSGKIKVFSEKETLDNMRKEAEESDDGPIKDSFLDMINRHASGLE